MPNQLDLLVFRTGRTAWEDAGRIVGSSDLPVSDRSLEVVQNNLARLAALRLSLVLSGPDEASTTTATLVEQALGGKRRVLPELREMSLGLWEGLTPTELGDKLPRCYRAWREDPGCLCPPEGETLNDVRDRLLGCLHRVLGRTRAGVVGIVLRPIAYTLVTDALHGVETTALESTRGDWIRIQVPRNLLKPRGMVSTRRSA